MLLTNALDYFIVWWDTRNHRRRYWYYSMETDNQCWQCSPHLRTLSWCCYRWRMKCDHQQLQIGFYAKNETSWHHWWLSRYFLLPPTTFCVVHWCPRNSTNTW